MWQLIYLYNATSSTLIAVINNIYYKAIDRALIHLVAGISHDFQPKSS